MLKILINIIERIRTIDPLFKTQPFPLSTIFTIPCVVLVLFVQKVNCVKFNQQDSSVILSGSYDATVRCWDCRSRSPDPIQVLDDAKDSVSSLQVSQHAILTGYVSFAI